MSHRDSAAAPIRVLLSDGQDRIVKGATNVRIDEGALFVSHMEGDKDYLLVCFAAGEWKSVSYDRF